MVDKMIRNAGRSKDGKAKAISVTQNGEIINSDYKIIKEFGDSVEVLPGESWESGYLHHLGDVQKMIMHTSFNSNQLHRVRVEEYAVSEIDGRGLRKINTITVRNQEGAVTMSGNQHLEVLLSDATTLVEIIVDNVSQNPFNCTMFVYGSKGNLLSFYNDEVNRFETQKEIANQSTLKELSDSVKNLDYRVIREYGSQFEVLPGETWRSEYFDNLGDVQKMIIQTSFNTSQLHRVRVEELTISEVDGQGGKKINTIDVRNQEGAVTLWGNQHLEVLLSDATVRARIIVDNVSDKPFKCGMYVYGSKGNLLSFYNDETYRFETQKEIANQSTLNELLKAVKNLDFNSKEPLLKKPLLKNVSILEDTGCDQILWFHDGFFYANKKSARKTLVKSSDGRTWEDVHTFTFEAPTSGISKVLVGDTGHMLVGNTSGEVFVSDSEGVFPSTATFTTGKLSHKFGRFKHENILGFTTYDAQGFDEGQKHEAWLSTDNGATYVKVFDNNTLQNLLDEYPASDTPQVHLHDMEYDPYSGRLYIWQGDLNTATFYYSDDWGVTWNLGFPRGESNNHTTIIATADGLAFGADSFGGGVGFLPLDRRKNIKPIIDIENFDRDHWKFNQDGKRFVAGGKWVDRENDVYLMTYTVEFDDNAERSAPLAYSKNGKDWQVIWHNFEKGHATGFDTIFYGNGLLVGSYRKIGEPYRAFIAEVDL